MGVKSTITISRAEAVEKYVQLKLQDVRTERQYEAQAVGMTDKELEDTLERLNDAAHCGEGFENYLIKS